MTRTTTRRQALAWSAAALSLPGTAMRARAAGEMLRDMRIIVPYPAGGSPDTTTRVLSTEVSRDLGINIVIENRPGASGLLGARAVSQGPADGTMMVYVTSGHVTLSAINPRFNLLSELRPVVRLSASPFVALVSAQSPYQTMGELVAAAQAQPGKLSFGTAGQGSPAHMAVEFLHEATGNFRALHVPFKGAVESINAILGGQIDFTIGVLGAAVPQIRAGRLRALGVTTASRHPLLPQVPTIAEATRTRYEYVAWGGLMMHPQAPDALVARLDQAYRKALQSDAAQKHNSATGGQAWPSESPMAFAEQLRADLEVERAIVRRLNLSPG
jgi:tripartite-type tricarboxylate transporter receptor subunit TctC